MKLKSLTGGTILTALWLLTSGPASVSAAGTPKSAQERGVVKSVDLKTHTLVVTSSKNTDEKFQWNDLTKFSEHNRSVDAKDLKHGEHVRVSYTPGGEPPVLERVQISPAKTKKHSAKHPTHVTP